MIVKTFENTVPKRKANFIQISYTAEDATKSISKLRKLDKQTKTVFKANYV